MPSDIIGTEVLEKKGDEKSFRFIRGPVFCNLLLADEINRTPPKTQAALLEAMQEKRVSSGGEEYKLDAPFFVLATQNPIEQEGTYPLPEAQLDRFMFNVRIGYPSYADEVTIVESTTGEVAADLQKILSAAEVLANREVVRRVPIARNVTGLAVKLVRATRPDQPESAAATTEFLAWGAGPRAAQFLVTGAKTRALLQGRPTPDLDDIRRLAHPVLRHRLVSNFHAEAEGVDKDRIVDLILAEVAP